MWRFQRQRFGRDCKRPLQDRSNPPPRALAQLEFATLEGVDWFNIRRLLEPIGNFPPAETEPRYYAQTDDVALAV